MSVTGLHICLESADAPGLETGNDLGARWVCACGNNFVWREGFNRIGHLVTSWWPAPAIPRQRRPVRDALFGPRQG